MQFSAKRKTTDDPHDFVVVPSDQVQVAPSDAEAAAPTDTEITDLLRAAARHRSEPGSGETPDRSGAVPVLAVDTTFRATAVNDDLRPRGPTFGRRVMRAFIALLLAIGIGAVALGWQTFGYTAKKALLKWAPKLALSASLPLDKIGLSSESAPASEPDVADATPAPAASPAPAILAAPETGAPEKAATTSAASSSDTAQLLQSMAHDLANVSQEVEILKASIAELKAGQKISSDKTAEPNARAKLVVAPPRPPATVAVRKPAPLYSPTSAAAPPPPAYRPAPSYSQTTQAAVAPQPVPPPAAQPYVPPPPIQSQVEPGFTSVPRPPMPVQQQ